MCKFFLFPSIKHGILTNVKWESYENDHIRQLLWLVNQKIIFLYWPLWRALCVGKGPNSVWCSLIPELHPNYCLWSHYTTKPINVREKKKQKKSRAEKFGRKLILFSSGKVQEHGITSTVFCKALWILVCSQQNMVLCMSQNLQSTIQNEYIDKLHSAHQLSNPIKTSDLSWQFLWRKLFCSELSCNQLTSLEPSESCKIYFTWWKLATAIHLLIILLQSLIQIRVFFFKFLEDVYWRGSSALISNKWRLSWWTSRSFLESCLVLAT